jgi:uncharacterized protein YyaL (SSP411 family)
VKTGAGGVLPPALGSATDLEALAAGICERVARAFDPEHGGFGIEPKFPLTDPLELCLVRGDAALLPIVTVTLDAMAGGALHDPIDGGFFRYATTRDWQLPHVEKMLDTNAALLRIYVHAGAALDDARYFEVARGIVRYIEGSLADAGQGGFFGSQAADEAYYAAGPDARAGQARPAVDHCLFADWNGRMISAYLLAADLLGRRDLASFAVRSVERLALAAYRPGGGVAHYVDTEARVRGLLADQVYMAAALLDAHEARSPAAFRTRCWPRNSCDTRCA